MQRYAIVLALVAFICASKTARAETSIHHPMLRGGNTHVRVHVEPLAECRLQSGTESTNAKAIRMASSEDGIAQFDVQHVSGVAPQDMALHCVKNGQLQVYPLAFDLTDKLPRPSKQKRLFSQGTPMPSGRQMAMDGELANGWANNWAGPVMNPVDGSRQIYAQGQVRVPYLLDAKDAPVIPDCQCPTTPNDPRAPQAAPSCDTNTASSFWVGLDVKDIIQAGTESEWLGHHFCSPIELANHQVVSWTVFISNFAWYEYFPDPLQYLTDVSPGDSIAVSVAATTADGHNQAGGGYGTFNFVFSDGSWAVRTVPAPKNGPVFTGSQAEWIVEKTATFLCDDFGSCGAPFKPPLSRFDDSTAEVIPTITDPFAITETGIREHFYDTAFGFIRMCPASDCSDLEADSSYTFPGVVQCDPHMPFIRFPPEGAGPCYGTSPLAENAISYLWFDY